MTGIASEADKGRFQECPRTLRARFSLCSGNSRCRVRGNIGQSPDFPDFPPEIMEDESQSVNRNECSFAFFILKIIRTGLPSCFFRLLLLFHTTLFPVESIFLMGFAELNPVSGKGTPSSSVSATRISPFSSASALMNGLPPSNTKDFVVTMLVSAPASNETKPSKR